MSTYEFGPFELREATFELLRDGQRLRIERRGLDLLAYLIRNRERVVQGDELLANVWKGATVTRASLARAIRLVRGVLGDGPTGQRWIETVRGRGYRFIGRATERSAHVPLPAAARATHDLFVGREVELAQLDLGLEAARQGVGQIWLVSGEPGIGKTRLLHELAGLARARGFDVLSAWCHDGEGAPSYWPWIQLLRTYARESDPVYLRAALGPGADIVADTVPELRQKLGAPPSEPKLSAEEARFLFFDSATSLFASGARSKPLLLTLDDLHSVDSPSLRLLEFFSRALESLPILLVAAHRNADVDVSEAVRTVLGRIGRQQHCKRIELAGLTPSEVAALAAALSGPRQAAALAEIHQRTGGNPFFVQQLLQDAAEASATATPRVPAGARDLLVGRTARLSEDCREVLRAASVVSTEWDGDVVCGISGLSLERFSAAIDEGLASGLVRRSSGLERFGFIHALVREMFYSELPTTIRRVLHGKVVAWLELHRSELDQGDVAYHAYHSAALDRGAKALEYSIRAAEHATRGLAYEDAVVHYGRALEMLEFARPRDMKQRRCELMIGLGESLIRCADRSAASEVFHKAAELARDIASGSLLARVALALAPGLTSLELGIQDPKLIPLLDEALELCEDDPEPRSLLLARLAVAQASSLSPDALRPLVDEAIRLADSTGKVPVQAYTRSARCLALWCPRNFDERRQETQDVLVWARRSGDRELQALAHLYRVTTLMEQGDPAAVRGQMAAFERMALELRQPQAIWYSTCFRTLSAFLQGRFTELRRLQAELRAAAQSMADNNPLHVAALHDIYLCAEEGSFERGLELCEEMASIYPPYSSARAWYLAELGRSREARAVADLYIDKGFERILRGMNQLCVLATLTEAVDVLGARDLAIALREEFDPDPDRIVMGGFGFCCWGAAARTLGQLATLLGEWDEAERLFERALELNARIGATVWIVRTRYNYTRMLLARGSSSDRACAREQIALALPVARSIGMSVVAARLEGLAMRAQSSPD